jgi:hypothetical protein
MYIYIHNESDALLTLTKSELTHGSFTPDWNPPASINPGEIGKFQGEGELFLVPTTGTEGNVHYQINTPEGGELYIHWNSRLIESQYHNIFHIWCPSGWDVSQSGGQGHEATLDLSINL